MAALRRRRRGRRRSGDIVHALGTAPAEDPTLMRMLARAVNKILNGSPVSRENDEIGFVMLVFPFRSIDGRCNYVSNAMRSDVLALLREQVRRFEKTEKEGQ